MEAYSCKNRATFSCYAFWRRPDGAQLSCYAYWYRHGGAPKLICTEGVIRHLLNYFSFNGSFNEPIKDHVTIFCIDLEVSHSRHCDSHMTTATGKQMCCTTQIHWSPPVGVMCNQQGQAKMPPGNQGILVKCLVKWSGLELGMEGDGKSSDLKLQILSETLPRFVPLFLWFGRDVNCGRASADFR